MTAGHGVAHAEERTGYRGEFHGVQLWVAQPERTRDGDPAFEHHAELPQTELSNGVATVLVGELAGTSSPARRDTDHVGADLDLRPGVSVLPLDGVRARRRRVRAAHWWSTGECVEPGHLAYLGPVATSSPSTRPHGARALLVGGVPFEAPVLMWWNFVARDRDEIDAAALGVERRRRALRRRGVVAARSSPRPRPRGRRRERRPRRRRQRRGLSLRDRCRRPPRRAGVRTGCRPHRARAHGGRAGARGSWARRRAASPLPLRPRRATASRSCRTAGTPATGSRRTLTSRPRSRSTGPASGGRAAGGPARAAGACAPAASTA